MFIYHIEYISKNFRANLIAIILKIICALTDKMCENFKVNMNFLDLITAE